MTSESAPLLPVFYDARTIAPGMTGVGRYTFNLLAALAQRPDLKIRAMIQPRHRELIVQNSDIANVEWINAPASHESHPGNELFLWRGARKIVHPGEVYHGPAFTLPFGARAPFPRVVTIHDFFIRIPKLYPYRFHWWLNYMVAISLFKADQIIFPSCAVANQLHAIRKDFWIPINAIHEAPDATPAAFETSTPSLSLELLENSEPFILSVGTLDRRKDPATARRAMLHLRNAMKRNDKWLWLGGPAARADGSSKQLIADAAQCGFHTTGSVSGGSVKTAMHHASLFVSCSIDEGFGIPLVEAMAAGRRVLATDIPVHREVCGDAAEYFPVGDHARLAELIAKLLDETKEATNPAGLARAAQFSWEKAAAQTESVYREAAAAHARHGR